MNILFVFSSEIPDEFAIAVLYIVTERSTPQRWSCLREFWVEKSVECEGWMQSIIVDNKLIHPHDSLGWWKTRIIGH